MVYRKLVKIKKGEIVSYSLLDFQIPGYRLETDEEFKKRILNINERK